MKIVDARTAVIEGNFDWVLVKLYTDEGIIGLGEAYGGAGVVELIERMKPALVGESIFDVGKIFEKLVRETSDEGSLAGTTVTAISGIELALWDAVGRALNTPICNLFGGKFRDEIRVYADCHAGDEYTPQSYAEKARAVVDKSYAAIKFDLDVPTPTPGTSPVPSIRTGGGISPTTVPSRHGSATSWRPLWPRPARPSVPT